MDEIKASLIQLINLVQRGQFNVDVQGAQQITAIITRATRAANLCDDIVVLEDNNDTED